MFLSKLIINFDKNIHVFQALVKKRKSEISHTDGLDRYNFKTIIQSFITV